MVWFGWNVLGQFKTTFAENSKVKIETVNRIPRRRPFVFKNEEVLVSQPLTDV